jgi:hypothetical protein
MSLFDKLAGTFDAERRWPFGLLLVGLGILVFVSILTSPLLPLEITFVIFIILSFVILGGAILLDTIIMAKIGMAIRNRISDDRHIIVLRVVGGAGTIVGLFFMIRGIMEIEWAKWSIREFYASMEPSRNPMSSGGKSLLDSDVLPQLLAVWKALFANIGSVLWAFISNMLVPWSWISTATGLFLGD